MRNNIYFAFLIFLSTTCFSTAVEGQNPKLIHTHSFPIEEIKYAQMRNLTNFARSGNLIAVNKEKALLQIGNSDLMVIELDSGRIEKKMDMHKLLQWVTKSLHEHWGEEYCVPGRESFHGNVKPEFYAIRFDRIIEYPAKGQLATLTHSVVFNQEKDNERDIFIGLLVFNENLEILDFYALKGYEVLKRRPALNRGSFFHGDTLFTMDWALNDQLDYEFIKFEKKTEGYFQMADTMNHWPLLESNVSGPGSFQKAVEREDGFHIPMGDKVLILQDFPDSGLLKELPLNTDEFIYTLEPIGPEGWAVTLVIHRFWNIHNEEVSVSGHLSLIEPGYQRIIPKEKYNFHERSLRSMSVLENKLYILFFNFQKMKFIIEVFDFGEGEGKEN